MKRFVIIISLFQFCLVAAVAQLSWAKKATKSVFMLKTFNASGELLGSATGFFIGEQGEGVSCYAPFRGAYQAVVIDAAGKEYPVECMLGANDTYDVAKFRVATKKSVPLSVATATEGSPVWLMPYLEQKKLPEGSIRKLETFMTEYEYYTVAMTMPDNAAGSPLMNEQGEVVGLMQQPYSEADTLCYAVSARFADSLRISGLSINDPALRATNLKKDLPATLDQAILTLYVANGSQDSATFVQLIEDFIRKFPDAADGYIYRAQMETNARQFEAARQDMEQAIKVTDKKDEAHYSYAKLIYEKELYMADTPYDKWSFDLALSEAREAEQINPLSVYIHQQAVILFAQHKYEEAYQVYERLLQSDMRSADMFYEASRCKEMQKDTLAQLALLDSCVAMFSKPYLREAAPYIFARAQARDFAGRYREAVFDYNDYESLMATQVNARFYYVRHRAEIGGRLYQQALNDINKAIDMESDNEFYYAERASLQVRVGLYDDAIASAETCVKLAPDQSDGYLFLGLAQCLKGQKDEGVKNLLKAKELGDAQADELIEKYSK